MLFNLLVIDQRKAFDQMLPCGGLEGDYSVFVPIFQSADIQCRLLCSRILFYLALDEAISEKLVQCDIYKVLSSVVVAEANLERDVVGFVDQVSEEANHRRKVVSASLKILFNFLMETKQPRYPSDVLRLMCKAFMIFPLCLAFFFSASFLLKQFDRRSPLLHWVRLQLKYDRRIICRFDEKVSTEELGTFAKCCEGILKLVQSLNVQLL